MGAWLNERRLTQTSSRLRSLRTELAVADEQIAHFADDAEELALRALVAETPAASYEANAARQHLETLQRHREHVVEQIAALEARHDRLIDERRR